MNTLLTYSEELLNEKLLAGVKESEQAEYMDKMKSLYNSLSLYLNLVDPFEIKKVEISPILEHNETGVRQIQLTFWRKNDISPVTFGFGDFDKILTDEKAQVLIELFNRFIAQLQCESSDIYQELLKNTKSNILFLLRKVSQERFPLTKLRFLLSSKEEKDPVTGMESLYLDIEFLEGIRPTVTTETITKEDGTTEEVNYKEIKLRKPAVVRSKDFKKLVLKSIKKMNNLSK